MTNANVVSDPGIEAVNELVGWFINQGDVSAAKEAAEMASRELTTSEIDRLVTVNTGDVNALGFNPDEAIKAAKLGASSEAVNVLIHSCIKKGLLSELIKVTKINDHQLTDDEIVTLVNPLIENRQLDRALDAADNIGVDWSNIEPLIISCIKKGWLDKLRQAAKMAGFVPTAAKLDCLVTDWVYTSLSEVVEQAKSPICCEDLKIDEIDALVTTHMNQAWTNDEIDTLVEALLYRHQLSAAIDVAATLEATPDTIDKIITACVEEGQMSKMKEVAEIAERDLTADEIETFKLNWLCF